MEPIQFTRINNDINGNPRYVCHFTEFLLDGCFAYGGVQQSYNLALNVAKKIGGKKFSNKQYGGGIVFQSYSLPELEKAIKENRF